MFIPRIEQLGERCMLTVMFVEQATLRPPSGESTFHPYVVFSDVDGDAHPDVVVSDENGVAWYRGLEGATFSSAHLIAEVDTRYSLAVGDIDLDGDGDVLFGETGGKEQLVWMENPGPGGADWIRHEVSDEPGVGLPSSARVALLDRDGDGDLDLAGYGIVGPVYYQDNVESTFSQRERITDGGAQTGVIRSADFNGDSKGDILISHRGGIAIYYGDSFEVATVVQRFESRSQVAAVGDVNQDGSPDVFAWTNRFEWFRNASGTFTAEAGWTLTGQAGKLEIVDVDGDAIPDFVAAFNDSLIWWRNLGDGAIEDRRGDLVVDRRVSSTPEAPSPYDIADVDGDGLNDLVVASKERGVTWYRGTLTGQAEGDLNRDGDVDDQDIDLLYAAFGSSDARFDLDGDDSVGPSDADYLVEKVLHTGYGDTNLDGDFSSSDLVSVFQRGKYAENVEAGWSDGDWNGDGRFDSSDLVLAFQANTYV